MVKQCVEQGAVGVAGGRMDHQAGRLVDDQDMVVFIDDVQLDVLGNPLALGFLLGLKRQHGAVVDDVARAHDLAIDGQQALFDPGGQARA